MEQGGTWLHSQPLAGRTKEIDLQSEQPCRHCSCRRPAIGRICFGSLAAGSIVGSVALCSMLHLYQHPHPRHPRPRHPSHPRPRSSANSAFGLNNGWKAYGHSYSTPTMSIASGMCVVGVDQAEVVGAPRPPSRLLLDSQKIDLQSKQSWQHIPS